MKEWTDSERAQKEKPEEMICYIAKRRQALKKLINQGEKHG